MTISENVMSSSTSATVCSQNSVESATKRSLLATLAALEPIEKKRPDVDESLLPLGDIGLETEIRFDKVDRSSASDNPNGSQPLLELKKFCQRWRICEFALFGSILRPDFSSDSDIDVMVSFQPAARWGLFAHAQMQQELAEILGRPVDLITKRAVEHSANWLIRERILKSANVLFDQQEIEYVAR